MDTHCKTMLLTLCLNMIKTSKFFIIICFLFCSNHVWAKKKKSRKNRIVVQWFMPKLDRSTKKNRTRVHISGKTLPNSIVYIKSKVIPIILKNKKIKYLKYKKAFVKPANFNKKSKKLFVRANHLGYFDLILDLPNHLAQLPIRILNKSNGRKTGKTFQLNVKISSQEARILTDKVIQENPLLRKKYALWAGLGINFLSYSASDSQNSTLNFRSFKLPSIYMKGWMNLSESFSSNIEYKVSPGETTSGEITIDKGSYNWNIASIDGTYSPLRWRAKRIFGNYYGDYSLRFGVQHHTVPFINVTSGGNAELLTNEIGMFTIGAQVQAFKNLKWLYEIYMRYQHPIYTGTVFSIKPKFAFDGSMGGYYKYNSNLRLGFFWYGQIQQYDVSGIAGTSKTGSQTLLFSNVEARIGYEW